MNLVTNTTSIFLALPTNTLLPFFNTSITAATGAAATTITDDGGSAAVSTDDTGSAATSGIPDGFEIPYGPSSSIWLDLSNPTEMASVESVLESESAASFAAFTSADRGPQCTASWISYLANNGSVSTIFQQWPFTIPASSVLTFGDTLITGPTTYTATEIASTATYNQYDACCGRCSIIFQSVDVYYWPVPTPNTECLASIDTRYDYVTVTSFLNAVPDTTRSASNTANLLTLRAEIPDPAMQSYAIGPGGHTLYSPNQYVLFRTVEATDLCGAVGGKYTSVFVSFAPGELSTVEEVGDMVFTTVPFDPSDLPCAPLAVESMDWVDPAPGLAPYQPVLAPVSQLYELDPRFAGCDFAAWQGIDPPWALTPVSALTPHTTQADPVAITQAPQPQSIITAISVMLTSVPPGPTAMGDPFDPLTDPVSQLDPPAPSPSAINPVASNPVASSPSAVVSLMSGTASNSPSAAVDPAGDSVASSPVAGGHPSNTQPLAASPNTAAVIAQGQTVWDNGPAVTIAGHTVMYSSSSLYVDGRPTAAIPMNTPGSNPPDSSLTAAGLTFTAYTAPQPAPAVTSEAITVAGQVFTANPSAFGIGGTTLALNGPAITLSGTPISLASAGLIIGGTQTIPIGSPAAFTANSITITPLPTGFLVDGSSVALLPGNSAITIDGIPVSLSTGANGGIVVIGTRTITFSPSATSAAGLGGLIFSAFGGSVGSASTELTTATHAAAATTYANGTIVYFQGIGDRATTLPSYIIAGAVVVCVAVSIGLL